MIISEQWFLCHRGVPQSVTDEIVSVLAEWDQDIIVLEGDSLSLSLPELRAIVQQQAVTRRVIVLLNEHLPGPVYRLTFAPVKKAMPEASIICLRVQDCDLDGVNWLRADIADVVDPTLRRHTIAGLVRDRSKEECR